jgi:hypothetical protein
MSEWIATIPEAKSQMRQAGARTSALVFLDDVHRDRRRKKRLENLINSWPIGVGILLSICAPMLSDILAIFKPFGMWVVFPFVELLSRPEMKLGDFGQLVPQIMLFLQFPLEGLLAKRILKGRVTISGVLGQVALYHILGIMQLWFVWRALGDPAIR